MARAGDVPRPGLAGNDLDRGDRAPLRLALHPAAGVGGARVFDRGARGPFLLASAHCGHLRAARSLSPGRAGGHLVPLGVHSPHRLRRVYDPDPLVYTGRLISEEETVGKILHKAVLAGVVAALFSAGPALAQQKVKIGFITTLSGP